ncbi:hypothetical protein BRC64_12500 [Halobacteriales archaeon QH_10_67_22]|nr:MAG: hypothetical protein BRC64_12500 [Halobacteriales archaeon QH_10_67_22]
MARGRTRSLALVAVAAATVVAGCGALGGGSVETVTPAPVPTDGVAYPPGVAADGVSPARVANAHERTLLTTNYTVSSRRAVVGPNGTMRTTNRTRTVAAGGETYAGRFDRTVGDSPLATLPLTLEYWTNGSVYASREFVSGSPEYYGWSQGDRATEDVDYSTVLTRTFDAVDVRVADRSADGVVLVGSRLRRPDRLPNQPYLTDPRNVSLTARVTDDGVVSRWRLAYDATVADRPVRVVWRITVADVGTTTVDRPPWVDTAKEWVRMRRAG